MHCPICGNVLENGIIEAKAAGSLTQALTIMYWYPAKYDSKIIKKNTVNLKLKTDGYYCAECMKVFAAFEER